MGYNPRGCKESGRTEATNTHTVCSAVRDNTDRTDDVLLTNDTERLAQCQAHSTFSKSLLS